MKRYVIVGLGVFGSAAAQALYEEGHEVVVFDVQEENVERATPFATRAVVGDATRRDVLERVGVRGADGAVVSTGDDLSASILAVMALRDLGVRDVYVKVVSSDHARVMSRLGVTETVFPERESARNLAVRIVQSEALLNYVDLGSGLGLQEMAVPSAWEGKTLRELRLPSKYKVSVVAVHNVLTDEMTPVPDPDVPLLDTHTLILTGSDSNLSRIARV